MMKKIVKNQKGITLISLVITVIILLLITGMLVYNARDSIYIRNYTYLENDIQNLRDKVSSFYNEYGAIPAKSQVLEDFLNTDIQQVFNDTEKQNMDKFYVLDLQALTDLTLHYGEDYELVKNDGEFLTANYEDLYIINEVTHNIFLAGGVKAREGNTLKKYYTDYSVPNNELVDFRYIDGIRIPDGYYYIGRNDEDNIVISPSQTDAVDSTSNTQYVWQPTTEIPENVNFAEGQTQPELEQSANYNNGYYYNSNTNTVIYLDIETLQPGETATKDKYIYAENGNIAKVPEGYTVSNIDGETSIDDGLVIYYIPKDAEITNDIWTADSDGNGYLDVQENYNQYVWIPCTTDGANGTLQYKRETTKWTIENDNNTLSTRDELTLLEDDVQFSETDLANGINEGIAQEIVNQVNAEITSIEKYGGFYIGRYEVGKENNKAVIQQDKEPYAEVRWIDAYNLAQGIEGGNNATSYLCSSYAWDTALSFIESKPESSDYGSNISKYNGNWLSKEVVDKNGNVIKEAGVAQRLNTGLTTALCNIYDMGGNVGEMTTELNPNLSETVVLRGGHYYSDVPAGSRWDFSSSGAGANYGFRATLFLK